MAFLRWLDIVFQGQYLPSLSVNYVAINKDLEKLTPQLYQIKIISYISIREIFCVQVRASHYSGLLSASFMFSCTKIPSIFAFVKCIVSCCCSRENETLRQYRRIIRGSHL